MNSHTSIIAFSQQLQELGVPKAQADLHVQMLAHVADECTVTPADLKALEDRLNIKFDGVYTRMDFSDRFYAAELHTLEQRIDIRFTASETITSTKIDSLRNEVNTRFEAVETKLRIHQWVLGLVLAICVSNTAMLVRLLYA
jgi:hypothetical protein